MNRKYLKTGAAIAFGLSLAAVFASAAKDGATLHQLAKTDPVGRELTAGEIRMARPIYGDGLDYSRVRLHNAPDKGMDAQTHGNDIYLEKGELHRPDLSALDANPRDAEILIHELTLVWRNQNLGRLQRLADDLRMQPVHIVNNLSGSNFGYFYDINSGTAFANLYEEQQASMVEDYFHAARLFDIDECATPAQANSPVCREVRATVHKYEEKLRQVLPLPGARTLTLTPPASGQPGAKPPGPR
jgi:hypothetical protein